MWIWYSDLEKKGLCAFSHKPHISYSDLCWFGKYKRIYADIRNAWEALQKNWKFFRTFAIEWRLPPLPLYWHFSQLPIQIHPNKGLTQCFWAKKHLLFVPRLPPPLNGKTHEKCPLFFGTLPKHISARDRIYGICIANSRLSAQSSFETSWPSDKVKI